MAKAVVRAGVRKAMENTRENTNAIEEVLGKKITKEQFEAIRKVQGIKEASEARDILLNAGLDNRDIATLVSRRII